MSPKDPTQQTQEGAEEEGRQSIYIVRHGDRWDYENPQVGRDDSVIHPSQTHVRGLVYIICGDGDRKNLLRCVSALFLSFFLCISLPLSEL
jgi:hypothetical protein